MKIYSLSVNERSKIWIQLNSEQQKIFNLYTMNRITSELLTHSFKMSSRWQLISVNIDYEWEIRKKTRKYDGRQYCECGRPLKYQYELKAIGSSKNHLLLGSTHFAEHAGIPLKVALEVQNRVNEIQIYMDEILYRYKHGERFPESQFGYLFKIGVMSSKSPFNVRMKRFRKANLPLFHVDENRMIYMSSQHQRDNKDKLNSIISPVYPKAKKSSRLDLSEKSSGEKSQQNQDIKFEQAQFIRHNLKAMIREYLRLEKISKNIVYVKSMQEVLRHIQKLQLEYEERYRLSEDDFLSYWNPILNSMSLVKRYERYKKNDSRLPKREEISLLAVLQPTLRLEDNLTKRLFQKTTYQRYWELFQLNRVVMMLNYGIPDDFSQPKIKSELILSKKAIMKLSHKVNSCRLMLQKKPEYHTAIVSQKIQEIYKLALKPKLDAKTLKQLIAELCIIVLVHNSFS